MNQYKYNRCRWVISSPDGVSFTNLEEITVTNKRDSKGRQKRFIADKPHSTTITVNTAIDNKHAGSGEKLQYGEFMIQLTPFNKLEMIRMLKKGWIVMDDIDLERQLLNDDSIQDTSFIEVESEPVMVEEPLKEGTEALKKAKNKERLDRLKVKVAKTEG